MNDNTECPACGSLVANREDYIWGVEEAVKTAAALSAAHPLPVAVDDAARLAFLNSREGRSWDLLRSISYSSLDGFRDWIDQGIRSAATPPEQPPT